MSVSEKRVELLFMVGYICTTPKCCYIEFTALVTKPINYCRGSFSNLMFTHSRVEKIDDMQISDFFFFLIVFNAFVSFRKANPFTLPNLFRAISLMNN